ncbi:hypothetical protein BJX64DRAFT_127624 [Aspergillus heterothallicus]
MARALGLWAGVRAQVKARLDHADIFMNLEIFEKEARRLLNLLRVWHAYTQIQMKIHFQDRLLSNVTSFHISSSRVSFRSTQSAS